MPKLAIIVTHPVQYYAPMFRYWAKEIDIEVLYCHQPDEEQRGKLGFGEAVDWGLDLLSGYNYRFLNNRSGQPDVSTFKGVDVPDIGKAVAASGATHVLIIGWHAKAYIRALNYCRKNDIPVASRGDSIINPKLPFPKKIIKKIVYPFFLNRFDAHLYVGTLNKQYLLHYGVKKIKLLPSPHAVDQAFWKTGEASETAGKNKGTMIFLWVGKFYDIKNPLEAVEGFLTYLDKYPESELHMVGAGELLDACKKKAAGDERIKFFGFKNQRQLKALYATADCLLLTSRSETWGLVVNEMFCFERPVLVSRSCGCVPDMVNNETGLTYEPGKTYDLAVKMGEMYRKLKINNFDFKPGIKKINEKHHYQSSIPALKHFMNLS